jgi:SRSO17 transposase
MSASSPAPGAQQQRLAAYLDSLAHAAGPADRAAPLQSYCTGLLLSGERKSVEPMAARLVPQDVRRVHQSLHHFVANAPWSDKALLETVRRYVLPVMERNGPVVAWITDDTGFPKKGTHSVGVVRQYCGQVEVGKQENCRVAVSLSVATEQASLPIAWRLYLPEIWAQDRKRRAEAGIPQAVFFATKPAIALGQIRQAVEQGVPRAPVLADAGYGNDHQFRQGLTELGLEYVVGIQSSTTVWGPGEAPLAARRWKGRGRPPKLLRRDKHHQPVTVKEVARGLPPRAWKSVCWREGSKRKLCSCFAAWRVRVAHRDYWRSEPHGEQWLPIEWPAEQSEPTKYWLATLPADTRVAELAKLAKHRWIIERDYEELKQELGLAHYEGRGWRGFHHHATLCIAAYGFLVAERSRFSPRPAPANWSYAPRNVRPTSSLAARRGRAERHNSGSIATLRIRLARFLLRRLSYCPFCCSRRL